MIRRSFRIGLWLGLLAGIGFALAKIFRPKPGPSPVLDLSSPPAGLAPRPSTWTPLDTAVPTPAPAPEQAPVPAPAPAPVVKEAAPKKAAPAAKKIPVKKRTSPTWVDPSDNICPKTHPVKGKLSSKIFQVPGNFAYDRTKPDRCYQSAEAATNDGLRPAKR